LAVKTARVREEECPAEEDAIGIRIPVQRAVPVEEKEEVGAVEETDKTDLPAIREQDWYSALVDDCQTIIIERGWNARMEVIQAKHEVGERIATDTAYDKFRGTSEGRAIIVRLSEDIGWSSKEIYLCIQFFEKYPSLTQACEKLPEGKAISWHKIANNYLTDKPRDVKMGDEDEPIVDDHETLRKALARRIRDSIEEVGKDNEDGEGNLALSLTAIEEIIEDIIDWANEHLFPKMRI